MDFYLEAEGLHGPVTAPGFAGAYSVSGFSFEGSNTPFAGNFGPGGGASVANLGDLTVTLADEAGLTSFLTLLVDTQDTGPRISLIGATTGQRPTEAYRIDLGGTHVVGVHEVSDGGYAVELAYQQIEVTQQTQNANGSPGQPQIFNYNLATLQTGTPVPDAHPGSATPHAPTPSRYFMLIDGVDGGSTEARHQGWFELDAVNFDLSTLGSGRVGASPVTVALSGQDGLTNLLKDLANGSALEGLRIEGTVTSGAANPLVVYRLDLGDVHVTDVAESDQGGFQASFDFGRIQLTTTNQNPQTGQAAGTNTFAYNLVEDTPSFGASLSLGPAAVAPPLGATTFYLEVDGLHGPITTSGFAGAYGVGAFHFDASAPAFGPGGLNAPVFGNLTVELNDASGLTNFLGLVTNTGNTPAHISLVGAGPDGHGGMTETYRIDLGAPQVVDVHPASGGGYSVEVAYQQIEVTQKTQNPNGSPGVAQVFNYDPDHLANAVSNAQPGSPANGTPNPTQYYLLVDGVDGGSTDSAHPGWFALDSFDVDLANAGGHPGASPLNVTLQAQQGLAGLLNGLVDPDGLRGLRIEGVTQNGGAHPLVVYKLELSDVHVTNLQESDADTEQVSFDFARFQLATTPINPASGAAGAPSVFGYDFVQQVPTVGQGFSIAPGNDSPIIKGTQFFLAADNLHGASNARGFLGDFEVTSFSFGGSNTPFSSFHGGTAPQMGDLTVTIAGQTGLTAFLGLVTDFGNAAQRVSLIAAGMDLRGVLAEAYRVDLGNPNVVDVHALGDDGYSVELAYTSIEVTQKTQNLNGTAGQPLVFSYDTLTHETGQSVPSASPIASGFPAGDPSHYYLLVDGANGGATDPNHQGWFDLGTFGIDLSNLGGGHIQPSPLTVDLVAQTGLAALLRSLTDPARLEGLRIEGTASVGAANPAVVYRLDLGDVRVTDIHENEADGYQAAFDFDRVQLTTYNVDPRTGALTSQNTTFTYNFINGDNHFGAPLQIAPGSGAPVNHAPLATAASATTAEDVALQGAVSGTDQDSADHLTFAVGTGPAHGALSLGADGAYTYTPTLNYNGTDSFTFTVNDGHVTSAAATVSLTVTPVNDAPVATAATATLAEDAVLNGAVTGTDVDVPTTLTFAVGTGPAHGTLSLAANGAYTYTPTHDFNGTDSFTFTTSDGLLTSAPATVSLTVTPVNDAPSAVADAASLNEKASITLDLLANDTDVDAGDAKTLVSVSATSGGGHVAIVGGQAVYTADADSFDLLTTGQSATDSFTYVMRDQAGATSSATVTLTINGIANGPTQTGGTGDDSLSGGGLDEKLDGAAGADTLDGGGGSDTLVGGAGNDMLLGGTGVDSLSAGDGNDTLIGGAGNDLLSGSRGADLFVFGPGFGHDTLIDFTPGGDHIQFQGVGGFASFSDVQAHAVQSGANVIITDAAGDSVQLNNVQLGALHAADFLFS